MIDYETKEVDGIFYEELSAIEYNERMRDEYEKCREYMEMKIMYEEGLLEF